MTNHLSNEISLYLQQHAKQPVHWHPWGEEALALAKKENKPILLSIGYSACHWCHVMAHESFDDPNIAAIMNESFINIKVDREERPDLDKIYQSAHYLLTQQAGGWPLTVFLTPDDHTPFFSGTYFPPEERYQLPAFRDVLRGIANFYQQGLADIKTQNKQLQAILLKEPTHAAISAFDESPIKMALEILSTRFDAIKGGFGQAPKFPQASRLNFLVALKSPMANTTLIQMAQGGIYDQVGFGFYRYAVDAAWEIPHFEKMLYDNAQLLYTYTQAYVVFEDSLFKRVAHQTAAWLLREMAAPSGGFYSSLDADSEGHEGKFYIWDKDNLQAHLTPDEFAFMCQHFNLDLPPNFEGQWHLHQTHPIKTSDENKLLALTHKLLSLRENRTHPTCDQKILTAWNGLAIKGLLMAAHVFADNTFYEAAYSALNFIKTRMWSAKMLFAAYNHEVARFSAYLDDYAFLLDAVILSLQLKWDESQLEFAIQLAEALLEKFYDEKNGGFFFTAHDHEKLLYRPKTWMDEALPAGNGVAVRCLLTLGYLLGENRYLQAAEKTLAAAWPMLKQYPTEHAELLLGLQNFLNPLPLIIIRGTADEMHNWQSSLKKSNALIFCIPAEAQNLPPSLAEKKYLGHVCAYRCRGMQCEAVIESKDQLFT